MKIVRGPIPGGTADVAVVDRAPPGRPTVAAMPDGFQPSPVREIALTGSITNPKIQISGMAWHRDTLLLVPQWGERLYTLEKSDLLDAIDGRAEPLAPRELEITPVDFRERLPGLEGFEAIAVVDDRAFLLVEAKRGDDMFGYLLPARLSGQGLALDLDAAKTLPPASQVSNMGYEALVVAGDRVLVLPEANANGIPVSHVGHSFDLDLNPLGDFPMPQIEYRLTDATPADADGRFWVANYNHPGDRGMPEADRVEQLLPMRLDGAGIAHDGAPLTIIPDLTQPGRNWEALTRLDDRGFLMMTDEFPRAILGFVERRPTRAACR